MRILLGLVLFAGCIVQAQNAINPPPAQGGGTLTCRQIAEQCDIHCQSNPLTAPGCLRQCGNQGTPDAAAIHNAVVDCGLRNSCVDQACMETRCGAEVNACMGPADQTAPANEPQPETVPPTDD